MKINELVVRKNVRRHRVGLGIAAGQGKTAGKGTKGQKARTGHGKREGFEGGQTPLLKRLPKLRGFRSFHPKAQVVYTSSLNDLSGKVTNHTLLEAGLIVDAYAITKLVHRGDVTKKLDVELQGASTGAVSAIQKLGGTFKKVDRMKHAAKVRVEK